MKDTFSQDAIPGIAAARVPPEYLAISAWHEHGPFALWLTHALRPKVFVELGSHAGFSYFCFCQAIAAAQLDTKCHAVDTWTGDEHAGIYSARIFDDVSDRNRHYADFSTLVRATFDDALPRFADNSVDLLHIDGRHYYDDVRHDFESWRGKLTDNALVLFHDTQVRERGFGVLQYFEELRQHYPTFEFLHGHGLGVLAMKDIPPAVQPLFAANGEAIDVWRTTFAELGSAVTVRWQATDEAKAMKPKGPKWKRSIEKRWGALSRRFTGGSN
jgi:hypothetical protein